MAPTAEHYHGNGLDMVKNSSNIILFDVTKNESFKVKKVLEKATTKTFLTLSQNQYFFTWQFYQ